MKQLLQSRITKRYVLLTFVVIFTSLASIYYITTNVLNHSIRSEIEHRNQLMGKTISTKTSFMIDKMINDTRVITEFAKKENRLSYQSEMNHVVSKNPLYLFIDVLDQSGNSITTIPNVNNSYTVEINSIVKRLKWSKTFYISNLLILDDGRKTFAVAYPILDEKLNYQGAVIAYVNLSTLSDYLSDGKIGSKGLNLLIDRNGMIVSDTDEKYIGKSISNHPLGKNLSKYRSGIWDGKLFNEEMLISYRPMTLGGLGLMVGESIDEALAPANQVQVLLLQGFFVVLLLTFLLTMFGAFRIIKPVTLLTKQAKEYSEGKRDNFDVLHTGDELEDLAITMGDMATELKNKERYLFNIVESIPYGIITMDNEGRIVTFNKGAEELSGHSREEVRGKYIIDVPFKRSEDEFLAWKTIKEGKEINEMESHIFDKYGNKRDVRIYSSFFSDEEQHTIGSILILRDVSDYKKMEEFVKQSEKLASLGQLTAGIAHEIKNPLSIIQAAAEAIQLDLSDPSFVQEMSDDILETTDRMNKILSEFLKLSKGDMEEEWDKVDLAGVIDELLNLLKNKFMEQNISVTKLFHSNEAFVYASQGKLSQVFLNIIINSLHAMEDGGCLLVKLSETGNFWSVEIKDTGVGIPESEINWIFDPFYTTKKEGTGLGLSIAYEITTQFGGEIHAHSDLGGTLFTIKLPKYAEEGRAID